MDIADEMKKLRIRTMEESYMAPGLPFFPPNISGVNHFKPSRFIPVVSVNYDYLPMNLDSPKMLWIDLFEPAPEDLIVNSSVKLHLAPGVNIQTTLSKYNQDNSIFEVDDIVGSRIVLNPYRGSAWLPTVHESCDSPEGWGYDLENVNVSPSMHGVKYGYGAPMGSLEYFPVKLTRREIVWDAAKQTEDYYRGSRFYPGWIR